MEISCVEPAEEDYWLEEASQRRSHAKDQNAGIYFPDLPEGCNGEDVQKPEWRKALQSLSDPRIHG